MPEVTGKHHKRALGFSIRSAGHVCTLEVELAELSGRATVQILEDPVKGGQTEEPGLQRNIHHREICISEK